MPRIDQNPARSTGSTYGLSSPWQRYTANARPADELVPAEMLPKLHQLEDLAGKHIAAQATARSIAPDRFGDAILETARKNDLEANAAAARAGNEPPGNVQEAKLLEDRRRAKLVEESLAHALQLSALELDAMRGEYATPSADTIKAAAELAKALDVVTEKARRLTQLEARDLWLTGELGSAQQPADQLSALAVLPGLASLGIARNAPAAPISEVINALKAALTITTKD